MLVNFVSFDEVPEGPGFKLHHNENCLQVIGLDFILWSKSVDEASKERRQVLLVLSLLEVVQYMQLSQRLDGVILRCANVVKFLNCDVPPREHTLGFGNDAASASCNILDQSVVSLG